MHHNVTALYRTYAVADLVRSELDKFGIPARHIRLIPDSDVAVGAEGRRSDDRYLDDLHDLHLPESDLRTYQHAVHRGDYVVSAEVDEDQVAKVQEIMRRPEQDTYDLDARESEFRTEPLFARSSGTAPATDARYMGRRDTTHAGSYSRIYRRDERLEDTHRPKTLKS
jgi:hypothetical protein